MEQLHKGRQVFSYAFPIMAPMGISLFVIGLGFWFICYESRTALVDCTSFGGYHFIGVYGVCDYWYVGGWI